MRSRAVLPRAAANCSVPWQEPCFSAVVPCALPRLVGKVAELPSPSEGKPADVVPSRGWAPAAVCRGSPSTHGWLRGALRGVGEVTLGLF